PIDLKNTIEELMIQFEEIFQDKELNVSYALEEKVISASPYLVDILLNNLLGNAIRHNYTGGKMDISLDKDKLVIRNTGDDSALQQDVIFKRFNKSSGSEGSGLGLTISKQICENLGFGLNYSFEDHYHTFTVKF
ncbi:MAG TPA: ATP-binding protein, partial [Mucilaginibacter sp.]|nr:ATP-binding protein [Mucilaginibacter sp.]